MKNVLFIFFLLVVFKSFTQSKSDLLNHLYKNNLFLEFDFVLKQDTLNLRADSLAYFKILNELNLNQDQQIIKNFEVAEKLIAQDTSVYLKLNIHFLKAKDSIMRIWFYEKLKNHEDTFSKQFKNYASILLKDRNIDLNLIPSELIYIYKEYNTYLSKKPIISAVYSLLFPGLGKFYNGRKYSFRNVLSAHILLGSKFVESFLVLGLFNPYTFITFGFLTTYYSANIVGSYFDLKEVQQEKRTQFILNVENHYPHYSSF